MEVALSEEGEGDFTDSLPETRTVTVSPGQSTVSVDVPTLDDAVDEPDGKIVARVVERATVYTVGNPGTAEVVVQDGDLPAVTITADRTPITEGETASFTVSVSTPAPAGGLEVEVALSEEGEGDFTDTLPETRTVTVPPGDRTVTVEVPTLDDAVDEPDGTIVVRVVERATVYTVGDPGTAEVVVQDTDLPAVTITADRTPITEGETASFTLTVSTPAPDGGLEVEVALSEEGEGDFTDTLPETRTVTVPPGDRTVTVEVPTLDDAVDEPDGKIVARVVERATVYTVGDPGTAEVVVQDGDLPAVTITADRTPITEGETASFTVSVSTPAPDGGLDVVVALSEEGEGDFTDTLPETRTVTVPPGDRTVTVEVPTLDDAVDEPDGKIVARVVERATVYTVGDPGTAEVVVQDGDLPAVTIAAVTTPIAEGEMASFTVSVSTPAPAGGLDVVVALSEEGEGDFTDTLPETRTVTVPAGDRTITVSVATLDDAIDEPDGTIVARVVEPATAYTVGDPGTAEVVVQDDDLPAVTIAADRTPITEGETASFTVSVSTLAPDGGLEVEVALSEEGEGGFTDTLPETRTVTVPAGQVTVSVDVPTLDDTVDEPDGKIVAQVQPRPGVFLVGDPGTAEVVVQDPGDRGPRIDPDPIVPPTVTITAVTTTITEGETASFTVTVSTPAPDSGLDVEVALSEEGGGDYTDTLPETRTVTVSPGQFTASVSVPTIDDAVDEPDGTIVARVVEPATAYTVGDPGAAEVVVQDADLPAVTIEVDRAPIAKGVPALFTEGEIVSFTLIISIPAPEDGLYLVVDLSEEGGGDYTDTLPETRTVWVPPGQFTANVSVPTIEDSVDEPDGRIVARVQPQPGVFVVGDPGVAEAVVRDNDEPANDDPTVTIIEQVIPRVGRTVAGIVTRAIDCRRYSRFAEDHATIGGLEVQPRVHATEEDPIAMSHPDAAAWNRDGRRDETGISADEVLQTSSFAMTTPDREDDTGMAWWAEGAVAGFTGRYEALAMHGDIVSGVAGLEYLERDRRSGIAVARSIGDVEYSLPSFGTGTAHSSLTSIHPYVCWFPSDDTWMWGMLGYGWGVTSFSGALTVEELDTSMRMGAFGITGELLTLESWELVWKASAFAVSMRIDEAWGSFRSGEMCSASAAWSRALGSMNSSPGPSCVQRSRWEAATTGATRKRAGASHSAAAFATPLRTSAD